MNVLCAIRCRNTHCLSEDMAEEASCDDRSRFVYCCIESGRPGRAPGVPPRSLWRPIPALRQRVEALLKVLRERRQLPRISASPTPTLSTGSAPSTEVTGTVIGPYKLLQPIGEGGMGTVYMAEQTAAGAARRSR